MRILRYIRKGHCKCNEIVGNNDESMDTISRSNIVTDVNFNRPFDVFRQSFYHYIMCGLIDIFRFKFTFNTPQKSYQKEKLRG